MKVSLVKTLAVACIIHTCLVTAVADPPKWAEPQAWRLRLQKYMTPVEVQTILGDPIDREVSNIAMIWYYQQGPTRVESKVTQRPKIGTVKFNLINIRNRLIPPVYAVTDFTEPDWDNIPDFPDEPQQPEEIEQAVQPEPPKKETQPPKPVITQPQKPANRIVLKTIEHRKELEKQKQQERLEKQRKMQEARQKTIEKRKADNQISPPEKPRGFASKYFLILGGIFFIVGAALIILKKDFI